MVGEGDILERFRDIRGSGTDCRQDPKPIDTGIRRVDFFQAGSDDKSMASTPPKESAPTA
jgi:hypothetical protein